MMKSKFVVLSLLVALVMAFGVSACSKAEEQPADEPDNAVLPVEEDLLVDGSAYGYAGTDPVECAVYKYLVEEVSKNFEEAEVSIPTVNIVNVDYTNPDEVIVRGDYWIFNYTINGDTLECVSGGNFPGVMHVAKEGGDYVVTSFDKVADGADFDDSAHELFGDYYDDFMAVYSDRDAQDELRKVTVSDYVKLNGLDITQYQDYGWDPVELYK